jgi:acetyl/propionyl-CoA carboxylase alpha subunit
MEFVSITVLSKVWISIYYDPMLAKLITYGETRRGYPDYARQLMVT